MITTKPKETEGSYPSLGEDSMTLCFFFLQLHLIKSGDVESNLTTVVIFPNEHSEASEATGRMVFTGSNSPLIGNL